MPLSFNFSLHSGLAYTRSHFFTIFYSDIYHWLFTHTHSISLHLSQRQQMFTRVNAFLEAIDKKTEEMADAADEKDIARAVQQQQQQQRMLHSAVSSAASSTHRISVTPRQSMSARGSSAGVVSGGGNAPAPPSPSSSSSSSPAALSTSASLRTTAQPRQSALAADAGVRGSFVPLPIPSKLPSFRPSLPDAMDASRDAQSATLSSAAAAVAATAGTLGVSDPVTAGIAAASPPAGFYTDNTVERLQSRCTALEADKTRWQQEAAMHKAQCSAARDALWKAEQEARSCRTAQRDAELALASYRETAQRLLDEAQQQLRQAQAVKEEGGGAAVASNAQLSAAQREELARARESHQQLQLLQAEHTALLSEVDRLQQEAAKSATELQRLQQTSRTAQAQVDELQLAVQTAQESLEGEVAAHADTKKALRNLQVQQQQQQQQHPLQQPQRLSGLVSDAADPHGTSSADSAEAKQRQQLLMLQLSNKQTLLDAAERQVADLTSRYNELARQFDDAQVEVAAGFRPPGSLLSDYVSGCSNDETGGNKSDGSHRPRSVASAFATSGDAHYSSGGNLNGNSRTMSALPESLKRIPAMVQLARQYGAPGRVVVSVLSAVDAAALRLGRVLTQPRWMWRVVVMGYVLLLQLWVVLLVLANLVNEEREFYNYEVMWTTSAPLH